MFTIFLTIGAQFGCTGQLYTVTEATPEDKGTHGKYLRGVRAYLPHFMSRSITSLYMSLTEKFSGKQRQNMMIRNAYLASNRTSSHVLIIQLRTNLSMSPAFSNREKLASRLRTVWSQGSTSKAHRTEEKQQRMSFRQSRNWQARLLDLRVLTRYSVTPTPCYRKSSGMFRSRMFENSESFQHV